MWSVWWQGHRKVVKRWSGGPAQRSHQNDSHWKVQFLAAVSITVPFCSQGPCTSFLLCDLFQVPSSGYWWCEARGCWRLHLYSWWIRSVTFCQTQLPWWGRQNHVKRQNHVRNLYWLVPSVYPATEIKIDYVPRQGEYYWIIIITLTITTIIIIILNCWL